MAAPTNAATGLKKTLANPAPSTHGPSLPQSVAGWHGTYPGDISGRRSWGLELNDPGDKSYIDDLAKRFSKRGATVYYVELQADLEVRLKRNRGATRLEQKPLKRDLATSEARLLRHDKELQLNRSEQRPFFYKRNYLKIDNATLAASEVAAIIKERFGP